jgi:hypothetical protein
MLRSTRDKILIVSVVFTVCYIVYLLSDHPKVSPYINFDFIRNYKCQEYRRSCVKLFNKLRNPNKSLIIYPPLERPPEDLMLEFTQNGDMPITKWWYINEAASSKSEDIGEVIPNSQINYWREKARRGEMLHYLDSNLRNLMYKHSQYIEKQNVVIIGTQVVWIESIAVELQANKIYTLDYTHKKYESSQLEWVHVFDYLNEAIRQGLIENFDVSASFSSIEHSGLGRYGDPLDPNGDLEAMRQVHCMLKPDGILFLGLYTSGNENSYLEFNAHRVYGPKRMKLIFNGWEILDRSSRAQNGHEVFVLKKTSPCQA